MLQFAANSTKYYLSEGELWSLQQVWAEAHLQTDIWWSLQQIVKFGDYSHFV